MEDLINRIGPFGRYQKSMLVIIGLISSLTSMGVYPTVFTNATPKLFCKNTITNTTAKDSSETCKMWKSFNKEENSTFFCEIDTTYYQSTIVTEWDLFCDRAYLSSLSQTIFMVGTLLSFVGGPISDKYGRKRSSIATSVSLLFFMILNQIFQSIHMSISVKYTIYCIAQFFFGFLTNMLYVSSYLILVEMTTSKYTTTVSNIYLYMYTFGELIVVGISYFSRNWIIINWIIAGFCALINILLLLFLPESPKFLVEKKRYEDAEKLLKKIAKVNGKELTHIIEFETKDEYSLNVNDIFNQVEKKSVSYSLESTETKETVEIKETNLKNKIKNNYIVHYLLNPKRNLRKTIFLGYIWITLSLIYYGVTLGITAVGDFNPYLIFIISLMAELIGYFSCHLNDKFGRKRMFMIYLGASGLMCVVVAAIPETSGAKLDVNSGLRVLFALLGEGFIAGAFNSAYIYTAKLYPTKVRSSFVLLTSSIGRIGSIISPEINLLRTVAFAQLPFIIFAISSIISCAFVFLLPNPEYERNL